MLFLIILTTISDVECKGSKERFDAILAQFGFTGIILNNEVTRDSPSLVVKDSNKSDSKTSTRSFFTEKELESEKSNEIPDEKRKEVKHRFYTFVVRRKMPKRIIKTVKRYPLRLNFSNKGGPFKIDPETGVKIPNPQLLNERIQNPVYKSRYPKRKKQK